MKRILSKLVVPDLETIRSMPSHLDRIIRYLVYALKVGVDDLDAKLQMQAEKQLRQINSSSTFSLYGDTENVSAATIRSRTSATKQTAIAALNNTTTPITVKHMAKITDMLPGEWTMLGMSADFRRDNPDGSADIFRISTDDVAKYLDDVRDGLIDPDTPPPLPVTHIPAP